MKRRRNFRAFLLDTSHYAKCRIVSIEPSPKRVIQLNSLFTAVIFCKVTMSHGSKKKYRVRFL